MRSYSPEPEVSIEPAGTPGPTARSVARRGWRILQAVPVGSAVDPSTIQAVQHELDNGADGVRLDLSGLSSPGDVNRLLSGVDLSGRTLTLAWGSPGLAAVVLHALADDDGETSVGSLQLGLDPASRLAASGTLLGGTERRFAAAAEVAVAAHSASKGRTDSDVRTFTFDDQVWHHAGADASVALGVQLASGVAAVRAMEAEGLGLDEAFAAIGFRNTLPTHFLYGIATLRAGQALWRRVGELCGVEVTVHQTAAGALREHTRNDPWVNILRGTASTFAGIVGGAEQVETPAYAEGADARRLARNTQLVLRDESHLGRVADPAGGSHVVEALTQQLARVAWTRFQEIEAAGGIANALRTGAIHRAIHESRDRMAARVRTRETPVLGVSRYPNPDEDAPEPSAETAHLSPPAEQIANIPPVSDFAGIVARIPDAPSIDALTQSRVGRGVERHEPLPAWRVAEPFERLREHAEAPVFFATLGPLAEHTARTGFGRELVESGGFRARIPDGVSTPEQAMSAWQEAGKPHVVLVSCATKRFPTDGVEAVRALTDAGARVWVLGRPGEHEAALRDAGARDFLFTGGDALEALASFWTEVPR